MANQKKMVEDITSMEEDFAQWYTDIVKKADLIDYSSVKYDGLMSLKSNLLCTALCDNKDNRVEHSASGASLVNSNEALFADHINCHRRLQNTWRLCGQRCFERK